MSKTLPKVAIICANYNYGRFIVDGMKSIISQTYEGELRLYVVDDGSSDDSWDKISEYAKDKDDIFIKRIENSGASVARNTAMEMCWEWADVIGVLDADDEYMPEKVEKLVGKLIEHDEIGVAYADYINVNQKFTKREFKFSYDRRTLLKRCIVHSNSLIKKEVLEKIRLPNGEIFDSRLHGPASKGFIGCTEDYDLWIRLSKFCLMVHVPECLGIANISGQNQSLKMNAEVFKENAKILGSR